MFSLPGAGNGICHRSGVSSEIRRESGSHDLEILNAFGALWSERNETLPADSDVLVIVVRPIDRKIVAAATKAIHRKLPRSSDSDAHGWSIAAGKWNAHNAGRQQRELVERSAAAKRKHAKYGDIKVPPE